MKILLVPTDGPADSSFSEVTIDYPLSTPYPGWSEQDPSWWWQGVTRGIRDLLEQSGTDAGSVAGLALSGQMHGATLLDASGSVLRPAILWNDQRSAAQCDAITERVGLTNLVRWVANAALAGFTTPKILWVRENEPEVYRRIARVLLPKDYINYRLTGEQATEVSDASGTLLFDVTHRRWSEEMLQALEIPTSFVPAVRESTEIVGRITAEAARATGLKQGTPVVAGGADNACAAVGSAVIRPGQVLASIGTSGTVLAPSMEPYLDPQVRLHSFCHAVPNTWYLMGVVLSAGGSLRWFRDTLAVEERFQAETEGRDPYEVITDEAAGIPPGSEGLIFLPYLAGERTPHGDPDARGVFFGLSLRHTRAHMARSVLEGVTFALGDSVAVMRELGIAVRSVRATGGGARSLLWRRMLADVLDVRISTSSAEDGPALGAALLAGIGVGAFSIEEGVERFVYTSEEIEPDPSATAVYRRYQELYDSLYPALADRFKAVRGVVRISADST